MTKTQSTFSPSPHAAVAHSLPLIKVIQHLTGQCAHLMGWVRPSCLIYSHSIVMTTQTHTYTHNTPLLLPRIMNPAPKAFSLDPQQWIQPKLVCRGSHNISFLEFEVEEKLYMEFGLSCDNNTTLLLIQLYLW